MRELFTPNAECTMPDATIIPSTDASEHAPQGLEPAAPATPVRKRPKPGERRIQILQALASMLEPVSYTHLTLPTSDLV